MNDARGQGILVARGLGGRAGVARGSDLKYRDGWCREKFSGLSTSRARIDAVPAPWCTTSWCLHGRGKLLARSSSRAGTHVPPSRESLVGGGVIFLGSRNNFPNPPFRSSRRPKLARATAGKFGNGETVLHAHRVALEQSKFDVARARREATL
jgi:hypothetical protein